MNRKTERFVDVLRSVDLSDLVLNGGWDISTKGIVTFQIPPVDLSRHLTMALKDIEDWDEENIEINYDVIARFEGDFLLFEGDFEVTYDEKDEQGE